LNFERAQASKSHKKTERERERERKKQRKEKVGEGGKLVEKQIKGNIFF
jgi:hypothetical protein